MSKAKIVLLLCVLLLAYAYLRLKKKETLYVGMGILFAAYSLIRSVEQEKTRRSGLMVCLCHRIFPEELLGDLEEEYQELCAHAGEWRAKVWYVGQVVGTVGAFLMRRAQRWVQDNVFRFVR